MVAFAVLYAFIGVVLTSLVILTDDKQTDSLDALSCVVLWPILAFGIVLGLYEGARHVWRERR